MKKRWFIVICVVAVCLFSVIAWKSANTETKNSDNIHELDHVLTFAEQKGTSYAADQLDYLIVYSYTKADIQEKWGMPDNIATSKDKNIWQLSDEYQLIISYDTGEQVTKIEVQSLN